MTADLGQVGNIWERPPARASTALKAAIYAERAKLALQRVLDVKGAHPAVRNGTVSRRYLARAVGCSYPTLTQNATIRELLDVADKKLAAGHCPTEATLQLELESLAPPDLPASVPRRDSTFAMLVLTNEEFRHSGASYPGVPAIVFADGIHEASGDWLRHLVVEDSVSTSTAHQYAKTVRPYLAFCRRRRQPWELADDDWLLEWRNHLLNVRHVKKQQANYSVQVLFQFYRYCEESGILRYRVGCYERSMLPVEFLHVKFPITALRIFSGREQGTLSWTTPLLFRTVESSIGNRATPTNDELEAAHREALKGRNGIRDTLLMSWVEDTGGRRVEVLQIRVSQIPDLDTVDALADQPDAWWPFEVTRKGGRREVLRAQPDTLYATHAYLRLRSALVKKFRERFLDYVEPEEVFISSTTGTALKPDSVTALVRTFFRRIGLDGANIHRIRAKFAVDTVETVLDGFLEQGIEFAPGSNWIETVLQQVAIRMGHKNPSSLRHYLTVALERRVRLSHATMERLKMRCDRNAALAMKAALERAKFASRLLADVDASPGLRERAKALRKHAAELEGATV